MRFFSTRSTGVCYQPSQLFSPPSSDGYPLSTTVCLLRHSAGCKTADTEEHSSDQWPGKPGHQLLFRFMSLEDTRLHSTNSLVDNDVFGKMDGDYRWRKMSLVFRYLGLSSWEEQLPFSVLGILCTQTWRHTVQNDFQTHKHTII